MDILKRDLGARVLNWKKSDELGSGSAAGHIPKGGSQPLWAANSSSVQEDWIQNVFKGVT